MSLAYGTRKGRAHWELPACELQGIVASSVISHKTLNPERTFVSCRQMRMLEMCHTGK